MIDSIPQNKQKVTVIIGASSKPERFAYKALKMLKNYGHTVYGYGLKKEIVLDTPIFTDFSELPQSPDTLTLYMNPDRQAKILQDLLDLNPRRIIFNPGTENQVLQEKAEALGIKTEEACTLVLLTMGSYDNNSD